MNFVPSLPLETDEEKDCLDLEVEEDPDEPIHVFFEGSRKSPWLVAEYHGLQYWQYNKTIVKRKMKKKKKRISIN